MSERKWKTGEVAMARHRTSFADEFMVIRSVNAYWQAPGGWPGHVSADDCDYRPLVVIDPEDREQVERLFRLRWPDNAEPTPVSIDKWQAALREFADPKPPRPEEPTGLGAVVFATCECNTTRKRFVRDDTGIDYPGHPWKSRCGHHNWQELDVRDNDDVLSDGIPA